ncbi:MAG: DUF3494 domain-containing protein, partial [Candidatus Sericytochromatia bacterium]|nr:DUF3494 domain-containing protein [Candidatus Sericytochromatia bacterium]
PAAVTTSAPGTSASATPTTTAPAAAIGLASAPTAAAAATGAPNLKATGAGKLTVTFDRKLDPATVTTAAVTLMAGDRPVAGTVTYVDAIGLPTVTFVPAAALSILTAYTLTISPVVKDRVGTALASAFVSRFTTGATPDTVVVAATGTTPSLDATGVSLFPRIAVSYSELLNTTTVNATTFTLMQGATAVPGRISFVGNAALFIPLQNLAANTTYTATITNSVKDLNGVSPAEGTTWRFTTGQPPAAQALPALGTAAPYAVLSGSTFATTGASVIRGDLGFTNGFSTPGFPPATINGNILASSPATIKAVLDLSTAISEVAQRVAGLTLIPDELGGLTLSPGLYGTTLGATVTMQDLTLDAKGDPNAVFIFQSHGDLTLNRARQVILTGGARATRIIWQVPGATSVAIDATLNGTLLATGPIRMQTDAKVNGRALSEKGPVTLDRASVLKPLE